MVFIKMKRSGNAIIIAAIILVIVVIAASAKPASAIPLFSQNNYLSNRNFDTSVTGWSNISNGGSPEFSWISADGQQTGVAQISVSGALSAATGSYYQQFNLSLPSGTSLQNVTFSAMWRISDADVTLPSIVSIFVQNGTNFTSCNYTTSSSAVTSWIMSNLTTDGSNNCFINNFTSNQMYYMHLRCELNNDVAITNETCKWDNATVTSYYYDTDAPTISEYGSNPSTLGQGDQIIFSANVTDNIEISRVWVMVNGVNYTMALSSGIYHYDDLNTTLYPWTYNYTIFANDTSDLVSSASGNFTIVDDLMPYVILNAPSNNLASEPSTINFSYVPFDFTLNNCSLYTNITGTWIANQTNVSLLNGSVNNFSIDLSYGSYLWNIRCCDSHSNCGFYNSNRTLHIAPDLVILPNETTVSNNYPVQGDSVIIYTIVHNMDDISLDNVSVGFYDGDPENGGILINMTYTTLGPFESKSLNATWIAVTGAHDIYVMMNPGQYIVETDYSNNKAYNNTFTTVWQTYYGSITQIVTALGTQGGNIANWSIHPSWAANIYVGDSSASVSWTNLQAIGRDASNLSNSDTVNDYSELDRCLGMENFTDNINATYMNGGVPSIIANYTAYKRTIHNVTAVESTNTTNFYTGILWDKSTGYTHYNCSTSKPLRPNVLFVTRLNPDQQGRYGTYDYEIRVPATLGSYKGSTNRVDLYYEII